MANNTYIHSKHINQKESSQESELLLSDQFSIANIIKKVEILRKECKFMEVLKLLENIDSKSLSIEEQIIFFRIKIQNLESPKKLGSDLDLINENLKKYEETTNNQIIFDLTLIKLEILINLGKFDEIPDLIKKCEKYLQNIKKEDYNESIEEKANVEENKNVKYHENEENDDKNTDYWKRNLKLTSIKGNFAWYSGEIQNAIRFYKLNLELSKKFGTKKDLAKAYGNLSLIEKYYPKAIDFTLKSNLIFAEIGDKLGQATNFINLGYLYEMQGFLDKALQSYEKGLEINRQIENQRGIALLLGNISSIYYKKGKFKKALQYSDLTLALQRKRNLPLEITVTLFDRILILLETNKFPAANLCVLEIEKIAEENSNERIYNRFLTAKAIVLKKMGLPHKIFQSGIILHELMQKKNIVNELLVIILLNYCDFILKQLYISNDPAFLDDIPPILSKLLKIADEENSFSLMAEIYFFQAKLELINLNLARAQENLTRAQHVTQEYGITRLSIRISQEYDHFLENYDFWQELQARNASKLECLEFLSLKENLEQIITNKQVEYEKIQPEIPLLLMINTESGISIYNYYFSEKLKDKSLFSSFMAAFNAFSEEFFAKSLDRIKIQNYTILINNVNDFSVFYVISGQSYLAQQKLNRFCQELKSSSEKLELLQKARLTGEILKFEKVDPINQLTEQIFGI
ncbi:MAG: tetratricopeptide repeat protein [Candidatus Lokiarchaeota archaeon]|nr:tetratricopeptide repeat protein [Candidatus Harpocratesius repetitus]